MPPLNELKVSSTFFLNSESGSGEHYESSCNDYVMHPHHITLGRLIYVILLLLMMVLDNTE